MLIVHAEVKLPQGEIEMVFLPVFGKANRLIE